MHLIIQDSGRLNECQVGIFADKTITFQPLTDQLEKLWNHPRRLMSIFCLKNGMLPIEKKYVRSVARLLGNTVHVWHQDMTQLTQKYMFSVTPKILFRKKIETCYENIYREAGEIANLLV